jgi:hypothetical protein
LWLRFGPPPGGSVERAAEAILAETGPDLGAPKAITATAHKLARIIYNLMRYGVAYMRRKEAAFAEQVRERQEKQLLRRAKELGFEVKRIAPPEVEPSPGVEVPSTPA